MTSDARTSDERIERAIEQARGDVRAAASAPADGARRSRTLAIGDPQAPFRTFLRILAAHDALDDDGRIRGDTAIVSMGDHFDWGSRSERAAAAEDALQLLAWLAAHPADQVVILAGNHDLARVGELAHVDDATFAAMQAKADAIDRDDDAANKAFARETGFAWAELVNRDFSTFRAAQRTLVERLLRERRMKLAWARGDLLFVHAGVTLKEMDTLAADGLETPARIADAMNLALEDAFERYERARTAERTRAVLHIAGFHRPGDADSEGSGALYHRPMRDIPDEMRREGRRFDPRTLPRGIVQLVGHIRDKKSRELLGAWADERAHALGILRHLVVDGADVRYRHGLPERIDPRAATMIFLDGGMNDLRDGAGYELFDVERRTVAERRRGD